MSSSTSPFPTTPLLPLAPSPRPTLSSHLSSLPLLSSPLSPFHSLLPPLPTSTTPLHPPPRPTQLRPLPPLPPPLTLPLLSSSNSSSSRVSSRGSSSSSRGSSSSSGSRTKQLHAPPLSSSLTCTPAPWTHSLEPLLPPPFSSLRTPTLLSLPPSTLTYVAFPSLAPPPPPPSSLPPPSKRPSPALILFLRSSPRRFFILVYMDGMILLANSKADMEQMKQQLQQLQQRLKCKDLDDLTHYLGMAIMHDRPARTITLSQSHYIGQLAPPTSPSSSPRPYAELVGSLMYAMMCTRPDLAYPISVLARFVGTGRHTEVHWKTAKRVLRYLRGTKDHALTLGGPSPPLLLGFSDSSWADSQPDHRSS
ncbi:unnamed protein product [Closterium sp. NIES-54]